MAARILPFIFQPTFRWAGNDGNWSTFQVNVGTPAQNFDILPSTVNGETWVPLPNSCPRILPDCASARGVRSTANLVDLGYQVNQSTTWEQTGIYGLSLEQNLFGPNDTGLYGIDTVSLGSYAAWNLTNQTVAGVATPNFWLGSLGLSVQPSSFSVLDRNDPSMLTAMKAQNLTPSISYGLDVGASYRDAAAGLVIGGYDQKAFTPNHVSFNVYVNGSRSLTASLQSLVVTNTLQGQRSMPITVPAGLNMSIDSTVSQIWLPGDICDTMADVLGLEYDSSRELYLVNLTSRNRLLDLAPEFTFTLAANSSTSNATTSITLPYSAFDQQVGAPYYNASTAYFPIRRAVNETQFVLGRTFLQEAYIVVDWERGNFTLAQTTHQNGVSNSVIPILPLEDEQGNGKSLSTGATAGIAVGAVVLVVALCFATWLFWRKKQKSKRAAKGSLTEDHYPPEKDPLDEYPADKKQDMSELPSPPADLKAELYGEDRPELMAPERHELHEDQMKHLLMSNAVYELPGQPVGHEMSAQREQSADTALFSPDALNPTTEGSSRDQRALGRFREQIAPDQTQRP